MNLDLAGLKVAGLTGGIATGKSTVAEMLAQAGATILDADRIAHNVYAPGQQAWQDIVHFFGESILSTTNEIDRQALGSIVFHDPEAKEALNRIVHPRVLEVMQEEIRQMAVTCPEDLVVLDVPLLIESGWHDIIPVVMLVYIPEPLQKSRLMRRDGLNAADAEARIRAQMPIDAKRAYADVIIDNTGSLEATRRQVLAAYRSIHSGEMSHQLPTMPMPP